MSVIRILRIAASALDLLILVFSGAMLATVLTRFGPFPALQWEDLSLVMLLAAALATLICLRPWSLFRRQPPKPLAPMVGVVLHVGFALSLALAMIRTGGPLTTAIVVKVLLPFALILSLNLSALGFRFPGRVPAWLWTAAALPTAAWAAFYGWPFVFAGWFFGVRPDG